MDLKTKKSKRGRIVGTVHCAAGWRAARRPPTGLDLLEVRVDSLEKPVSARELGLLPLPVLVTVRDPAEGGERALSAETRHSLLRELLPPAWGIDIEVANLKQFKDVVVEAHAAGRVVVGSLHDFEGVPGRRVLGRAAARAREEGADIFKVAARVDSLRELVVFLEVLEGLEGPVAAMGMGAMGRVARLVCAASGSALNYGWLGRAQVPGQWPAAKLRDLVDAVCGD